MYISKVYPFISFDRLVCPSIITIATMLKLNAVCSMNTCIEVACSTLNRHSSLIIIIQRREHQTNLHSPIGDFLTQFGASMSIVFGVGIFFQSEVGMISCAFIASCICGCIVYGISRYIGLNPNSIVLVGISLNYLFSAMTATIEFFAKEHKLEAVVQWTFGSFNKATWENVLISFIVVAIASFVIWKYSLILNVMASNNL